MARFVLIVEDSDEAASMLEIALGGLRGYGIRRTADGAQALETMRRAPESVAAIVTDLNLPRTNGFELIGEVRADPRWSGMPIVVVSGDADPATPARLRRLGADAFFSKPYSPAQVATTIERLLHVTNHDGPDTDAGGRGGEG